MHNNVPFFKDISSQSSVTSMWEQMIGYSTLKNLHDLLDKMHVKISFLF